MTSNKDSIEQIISDRNIWLPHESCSGYPYLKLSNIDHNISNTENTYNNLAEIIKKYSYTHSWINSRCCFFDIHPIFSDSLPIPSLMGLHLALQLFDKGVAGTSQSLFFDTASNWRKFTRITEKRVYPVASWLQINLAEFTDNANADNNEDNEEYGVESVDNIYLPTSINLIKGNELASIHTNIPTDFKSGLIQHYRKENNKNITTREILITELSIFKNYISEDLEKNPKFEKSALYLFCVIFCREFGFDYSDFDNVIKELGLNFDFNGNNDVLHYTDKSLSYIHNLRVKFKDYHLRNLTFEQYDSTLLNNTVINEAEHTAIDENSSFEELSSLIEREKSHSLELNVKFYDMMPAISDIVECKKYIYRKWKDLVLCFYGSLLDQELYNKLRNIMDSYVLNEISKRKILEFENLDTQNEAMNVAAFEIFMHSVFDLNIVHEDSSKTGTDLFNKLTPPRLTEEQISAKNLLNTTAQEKYIEKIMEQHKNNLIFLLNLCIGKLAHPNFSKEHGLRLAKIDHDTLKQIIIDWYNHNYIKEYLRISNRYEDIYKNIENDFNLFSSNPLIEKALLREVQCFVSTKYNPHLLLDFNINF